jgi:hypothetical protein
MALLREKFIPLKTAERRMDRDASSRSVGGVSDPGAFHISE